MSVCILIADDDESQRHTLCGLMQRKMGYQTLEAEDGLQCLERLKQDTKNKIKLVILDLHMPVMSGLEALEAISQKYPNLPVIVLTGQSKVDNAVQSMKLGATDFLTKPVQAERMIVSIQNALKMSSLTKEVERLHKKEEGNLTFSDLIGSDTGLLDVVQRGRKAASSNIPVLLTGETGVGKEVFANAIHGESGRAGRPFIAVNCGALPEKLIESILFGHEKGAFTGAITKTAGKFREANGGTIFLDEVGELPHDAQVKLLRVLQQKEVEPVGAAKTIPVDVRVISATNRDLNEEVQKGNFREDLYYRLNVLQIEIPPLRQRQSDILPLAQHFIERFALAENKAQQDLSQEAENFLTGYNWSGNVRELENAIHRAVVLSDNKQLTIGDFTDTSGFEPHSANAVDPFHIPMFNEDGTLKTLEQLEKDALQVALNHYNNNVTKTAKALGIAKSTFYRKAQMQ